MPTIFISLAIVAMLASQGQILLNNLDLMWQVTIHILLYFIVNFKVNQHIGQLMSFSYSDRTNLNLTTLARNSPIALAVAMTAFPDLPLIALTLVIGPLLALPSLAIINFHWTVFYLINEILKFHSSICLNIIKIGVYYNQVNT